MAESEHPARRNRKPIHGTLVAVDAPSKAAKPWVVDGIDISAHGMGLVLPPEIEEGTDVLLSFKLDDEIELSRVPATVRHQISATGGVAFQPWPAADRLKLLEFLVAWYERDQRDS